MFESVQFIADLVEEDAMCSNGDVRLVGGANELEGRLEICINRAWGTVCSDGFSENEANIVCSGLLINITYNGTPSLLLFSSKGCIMYMCTGSKCSHSLLP